MTQLPQNEGTATPACGNSDYEEPEISASMFGVLHPLSEEPGKKLGAAASLPKKDAVAQTVFYRRGRWRVIMPDDDGALRLSHGPGRKPFASFK
jgi:hypothetical protein